METLESRILRDVARLPDHFTSWKVWRLLWSRNAVNVRVYRLLLRMWIRGDLKLTWGLRWRLGDNIKRAEAFED